MDVIFGLIPAVLLFGLFVVIAFIWMAKRGFFDDLDGQAHRILMEDDDYADKPAKTETDTANTPAKNTAEAASKGSVDPAAKK